MPDKVRAFRRCEQLDRGGDQLAHAIKGSRSRRAEKRFQFRECLFDRIEVGTVRRQEAEKGTGTFDGGLRLRLLVHREVVEHDHIAGAQRGHQHLFDIGEKRCAVDRAVEHRGRRQSVQAQSGDDGVRLPMTAWRVIVQARAARAAPIAAEQIRRDATFIEKDVLPHVTQRLRVAPLAACPRDVRATLFVGVYGFF